MRPTFVGGLLLAIAVLGAALIFASAPQSFASCLVAVGVALLMWCVASPFVQRPPLLVAGAFGTLAVQMTPHIDAALALIDLPGAVVPPSGGLALLAAAAIGWPLGSATGSAFAILGAAFGLGLVGLANVLPVVALALLVVTALTGRRNPLTAALPMILAISLFTLEVMP